MANARPVSHKVVTLDGTAQQLALAIDMPGVRIRSISMQPGAANAAAVFVGGPGVTASDYGVRLPASAAGVPAAPYVVEDSDESTRMDDWYVIGTDTEKLHLLVVAYV